MNQFPIDDVPLQAAAEDPSLIERANVPVGLPITLQQDSYLPTDASSFYMRGVPILSAFTGSHREYHTPRDTPDTLNYEGMARFAGLGWKPTISRWKDL